MEKELFSAKVGGGRRTYFFDIKESGEGKYIAITETKKKENGDFGRARIIVDCRDLKRFQVGIKMAIDYLSAIEEPEESKDSKITKARTKYPRAFIKWTVAEEKKVKGAFKSNKPIEKIAAEIQRKPSAVTSRLVKLGLIKE